jgi:hypothetical protein
MISGSSSYVTGVGRNRTLSDSGASSRPYMALQPGDVPLNNGENGGGGAVDDEDEDEDERDQGDEDERPMVMVRTLGAAQDLFRRR